MLLWLLCLAFWCIHYSVHGKITAVQRVCSLYSLHFFHSFSFLNSLSMPLLMRSMIILGLWILFCYFHRMKITCLIGTQDICIKGCDKQTEASEHAHVHILLNSIKNANESLKQNLKKKNHLIQNKTDSWKSSNKINPDWDRVTLKLLRDDIVFCLSLFIQLDIHYFYKQIY